MTVSRQSPSLALLPPELHTLITRHLPLRDLVWLSRSCRAYCYVADPVTVARKLHTEHLYDAFIHAEKLGVRSVGVYEWFLENINPSDPEIPGAVIRAAARAGDLAVIRKYIQKVQPGDSEKTFECVVKELAAHGHAEVIREFVSDRRLKFGMVLEMAHSALWNRHYDLFRSLTEEHGNLWTAFASSRLWFEAIFTAHPHHWDVVEFVVYNCPNDLRGKAERLLAAKAALAIKNRQNQQFAESIEAFGQETRAKLFSLAAACNNVDAMQVIYTYDDGSAGTDQAALSIAVVENHQEAFDYIVNVRCPNNAGLAYSNAIVLYRHTMAATLSSLTDRSDVLQAIIELSKLNRRQEIDEQVAFYESKFHASPFKDKYVRYRFWRRIFVTAAIPGSYELLCDLAARFSRADAFMSDCNDIICQAIEAGHLRVVAKILQNDVAGLHIDVPSFISDYRTNRNEWTIPIVQGALLVALKHPELFSLLHIKDLRFKVRLKNAFAGAIRVAKEEGFELSEEHVDEIRAFILKQNSE